MLVRLLGLQLCPALAPGPRHIHTAAGRQSSKRQSTRFVCGVLVCDVCLFCAIDTEDGSALFAFFTMTFAGVKKKIEYVPVSVILAATYMGTIAGVMWTRAPLSLSRRACLDVSVALVIRQKRLPSRSCCVTERLSDPEAPSFGWSSLRRCPCSFVQEGMRTVCYARLPLTSSLFII